MSLFFESGFPPTQGVLVKFRHKLVMITQRLVIWALLLEHIKV
jgi:hypothetical protein